MTQEEGSQRNQGVTQPFYLQRVVNAEQEAVHVVHRHAVEREGDIVVVVTSGNTSLDITLQAENTVASRKRIVVCVRVQPTPISQPVEELNQSCVTVHVCGGTYLVVFSLHVPKVPVP